MQFNFFYFLIFLTIAQARIAWAQSCTSRYAKYDGTCVQASACKGALLNNLCPGSLKCCAKQDISTNQNFVTEYELKSIIGFTNERISYTSRLLKPPTSRFTCNQKAAFLSQLAHESSNFMLSEEEGSEDYFKKYDNKLGNNQSGDGARFRGRGFIQIAGHNLYPLISFIN